VFVIVPAAAGAVRMHVFVVMRRGLVIGVEVAVVVIVLVIVGRRASGKPQERRRAGHDQHQQGEPTQEDRQAEFWRQHQVQHGLDPWRPTGLAAPHPQEHAHAAEDTGHTKRADLLQMVGAMVVVMIVDMGHG
jgi:hypothetical protein